jgi:hypothetical protein
MRNRLVGMAVVVAVLQMIGARDGYSARILAATETTGMPGGDITSATDSGLPPPGNACTPANENLTACFGTPYQVNPSFLAPGVATTGGIVGVNLCDSLATDPRCLLDGRDPNNTISDQLYLQVTPASSVLGMPTLTWCWDSDLEGPGPEGSPGGINICQDRITVPSANLFTVQEPSFGTVDLTSFFTAPNGPLAGGGVWQVTATSEMPEPASLSILAVSLLGIGAYRRLRR